MVNEPTTCPRRNIFIAHKSLKIFYVFKKRFASVVKVPLQKCFCACDLSTKKYFFLSNCRLLICCHSACPISISKSLVAWQKVCWPTLCPRATNQKSKITNRNSNPPKSPKSKAVKLWRSVPKVAANVGAYDGLGLTTCVLSHSTKIIESTESWCPTKPPTDISTLLPAGHSSTVTEWSVHVYIKFSMCINLCRSTLNCLRTVFLHLSCRPNSPRAQV